MDLFYIELKDGIEIGPRGRSQYKDVVLSV